MNFTLLLFASMFHCFFVYLFVIYSICHPTLPTNFGFHFSVERGKEKYYESKGP